MCAAALAIRIAEHSLFLRSSDSRNLLEAAAIPDYGGIAVLDNHLHMRPFFGYYGGKWRDTIKHYPSPEHKIIVEPFAGSAGFSIRYADHKVIQCELDPVIAAVWQYLIRVKPREILSIPDVFPGESIDDLNICQEAIEAR
jgi:hypothetical protein